MKLERLLQLGAVHGIGMGGGLGDDRGGGGAHGGGHGIGDGNSRGGRSTGGGKESGAGSPQSADQGRGGQADVGGSGTDSRDSADRARAALNRRNNTNAFAANREMDRYSATAHPGEATPESDKAADHARRAMTEREKQELSEKEAGALGDASARHGHRESGWSAASGLLNAFGLAPVGAIVDAGSFATKKTDAMEDMGFDQDIGDFGYEAARGLAPGTIGRQAGAQIGSGIGGMVAGPIGGVLGGLAGAELGERGVAHAMDPNNHNGSTGQTGLQDGRGVPQVSRPQATPTPQAPAPNYSYAPIDLDAYQRGLLNARVRNV